MKGEPDFARQGNSLRMRKGRYWDLKERSQKGRQGLPEKANRNNASGVRKRDESRNKVWSSRREKIWRNGVG